MSQTFFLPDAAHTPISFTRLRTARPLLLVFYVVRVKERNLPETVGGSVGENCLYSIRFA